MIDEEQRRHWSGEFAELGIERVRSHLVVGRWPRDKRDYARQWVERQDVRAWHERKPETASPARGLAALRSYKKVWGVVAGLMFGGYALIRVISRFKGY